MSRTSRRAPGLAALLALAAAVALSPSTPRAQDAPEVVAAREAGELLEAGRAAEAVRLLRGARREHPAVDELRRLLAVALSHQGREHHERGEDYLARRAFAEAERLAPDEPALQISLAMLAFEAGELADARRRLARLADSHPDLVEAHSLLAQVAREQGDTRTAARHAMRALELDPADQNLQRLAATTAREGEIEGDFVTRRLGRFVVQHDADARDDPTMEKALASLRRELPRAYDDLRDLVGRAPRGTITVMLYSPDQFRRLNVHGGHVIAFFDGKLRLAVGEDLAELTRNLRHELTHAFVSALFPQTPPWLHEGLAQHVEGDDPGQALVRVAKVGKLLPPSLFERRFARMGAQVADLGYAQALLCADHLVRLGKADLRQLLALLGNGLSSDDALQRVHGTDLRELSTTAFDAAVARQARPPR